MKGQRLIEGSTFSPTICSVGIAADHHLALLDSTSNKFRKILGDPITIQANCMNLPMTSFEKFDFNRSDWIKILQTGSMSLTRFHLMNSSLW